MKTFLSRSKSSILFLVVLTALPAWSKPVTKVVELSGQVFGVSPEGKTWALKVDDHIEEKTEVMVEEGANVTLTDYYDSTYHLVGGGHLKFFDRSVQLKRGKTWIQALNPKQLLVLTTANGHVEFSKGEFIATFDQASGRSQILVVGGEVEVSNILDRNMKHAVSAGTFTLVDPEVESGQPRSPTRVGLTSLNEALGDFKRMPKDWKTSEVAAPAAATRGIASVSSTSKKPRKGKITYMTSNRMPASVAGGAHNYWQSKVGAQTDSPVPIKFYGMNWKAEAVLPAPRKPASNPPVVLLKPMQNLKAETEFDESLKKEIIKQPKYTKEHDSLIEDLLSY